MGGTRRNIRASLAWLLRAPASFACVLLNHVHHYREESFHQHEPKIELLNEGAGGAGFLGFNWLLLQDSYRSSTVEEPEHPGAAPNGP